MTRGSSTGEGGAAVSASDQATEMDALLARIILDVPAERPIFRFCDIARALTSVVLASEPQFVMGIFGGWGSGKSTLMGEIQRLVTEQQRQAVVVHFNAWRYEREAQLITPLLDTVRASLADWAARQEPDDPRAERVRGIAGRIGHVVRALVRATSLDIGVPGTVSLTVNPGKALDELISDPDDAAASPQSLYYGAFQELNGAFSAVREAGLSRIVVFVDDLDRCLPERALTVLESMKLFFDTPGFIFVVGLDEQVIASAISRKLGQSSTSSTKEDVHGGVGRE